MYGCESWTTTRYLCARIDASDTWALVKILRIPYNRHITNPQVRAVSGRPPLSNMVMKWLLAFFGCTSHAVLLIKTITMQLLLRFASLHQTGNDLQEDPNTRGSEPLSRIWDHWTSVLRTRGGRQPLENTGVRLWTRLRSRRVYPRRERQSINMKPRAGSRICLRVGLTSYDTPYMETYCHRTHFRIRPLLCPAQHGHPSAVW